VQKKLFYIFIGVSIFIFICSITAGFYFRNQYYKLRNTIESANAGELQQQLGDVTAELERTKNALYRSEQSVEQLAELDQRRDAGIERIRGIIDEAGKSVSGIASGEQRARIAFEAIARIVDELETEFSGSAK